MKLISITIFTITMAVAAVHAAATGAELHRERRILMKKRQAVIPAGVPKTQDQINREQLDSVLNQFSQIVAAQEAAKARAAAVPAPAPQMVQPQVLPAFAAPPPPPPVAPASVPPAIQALIDNGCTSSPGSTGCGGAPAPVGAVPGGVTYPVPAAIPAPVPVAVAVAPSPAPTVTKKAAKEEEDSEEVEKKEEEEKDQEKEEEKDQDQEEEKDKGEEEKGEEEKDEPEDEDESEVEAGGAEDEA